MKVNKKKLAEIFNVDPRTIERWQSQGLPCVSGGGTAKEQIYNRFTLTPEGDEPLPGAVHFPNNPDIFDLTEAQQLTAEEQVEKWVDGRKKILWDSKKRRNEALDCFVYALAALRISIS
ncbi:phage terminase large subunit family protein, partial [Escherichia coli 2-474-04_S3_C3]